MKDPIQVLRMKELELARVKKEVDALRIVAKMMSEDDSPENGKTDLRQVVPMP
jgi:hypothetical protein